MDFKVIRRPSRVVAVVPCEHPFNSVSAAVVTPTPGTVSVVSIFFNSPRDALNVIRINFSDKVDYFSYTREAATRCLRTSCMIAMRWYELNLGFPADPSIRSRLTPLMISFF